MKIDLTKLAAASMLALTATAAQAGSVTQMGETVGVAAGTPLAPGWYFLDTTDWGVRDTNGGKTALGVTIPVIAWSTPWTALGARVQFLAAFPAVEAGVTNSAAGPSYAYGWYNPFFAGQLAWDLGKTGWGFSYLLGTYPGISTPVAKDETSLNQRFALSYTRDGWNLTANVILGTFFDSTVNPDFINVDLTATKKFGNWEIGMVGFGSSDISTPFPGYQRQSQFALGGLVGYYFGPVILQGYLTRDVSESNYGGYDTRIWGRIIIPILDPPPAPAPVAAVPLYRR
jgi:hypothetical protein